jgi:hypothetical protein
VTRLLMRSGKHNPRRGCDDCAHLHGLISWWCDNEDAIKRRNSSIPGVVDCPQWSPCAKADDLEWGERTFGDWMPFDGDG